MGAVGVARDIDGRPVLADCRCGIASGGAGGRRLADRVSEMKTNRLIAERLTDEELQCFRAKLRKYAEVVPMRRRAA